MLEDAVIVESMFKCRKINSNTIRCSQIRITHNWKTQVTKHLRANNHSSRTCSHTYIRMCSLILRNVIRSQSNYNNSQFNTFVTLYVLCVYTSFYLIDTRFILLNVIHVHGSKTVAYYLTYIQSYVFRRIAYIAKIHLVSHYQSE